MHVQLISACKSFATSIVIYHENLHQGITSRGISQAFVFKNNFKRSQFCIYLALTQASSVNLTASQEKLTLLHAKYHRRIEACEFTQFGQRLGCSLSGKYKT